MTRPTEEIIEDIVRELGDLPDREFSYLRVTNLEQRSEIVSVMIEEDRRREYRRAIEARHAAVKETIEALQAATPEFFSRESIQQTRESAEKMLNTVVKLQGLIEEAPPELRLRIADRMLSAPLQYVRTACEDVINSASKEDRIKRQARNAAAILMTRFTEEGPTWASADDKFPAITGLICEAMAGKVCESGFKNLCRDWLTEQQKRDDAPPNLDELEATERLVVRDKFPD